MKNKKIISLICALAMVFSMFSAFTIANAEVTKGIELAGELSKDGKTLTIDATAKGMDASLLSFGIKFAVPEGVTDDKKVTYTAGAASGTWTPTLVNGIYTLSFFNMTPVEFKDGKLATITIELDTELKSNYELKLEDTAMIQDTTNGKLAVSTGMDNAAVTVPKWQDPNKKPDTVTRPDKETEPETPDVPKPVPVGEKGIDLAASLNKDNTILTIDATAKGMDASLLSFGIKFAAPEGVTDEKKVTYTAGAASGTWTPTLVNGIYTLSFFNMTPVEFKDGKLATITIELPAPATKPIAVTLDSTAMIQDTTNGKLAVSTGAMEATSAVATPSTDEPKYTTTQLKKFVGKGYEEAIAAVPEGKAVYLTVDVKKGAEDAVYGTDYVAEYPAGTKLTEAAYNNLIHGYTDADMADVINNLTFRVYGSGLKISTTLNGEDQESQLVDPVVDQAIDGKQETAKKASINVTPSRTKAVAGDGKKVTVTTRITNPSEDGVLTVKTTSDSIDCVSGSGIKVVKKNPVEGEATVTLSTTAVTIDPTDTIEFMPAVKGAVVLSYEYKYTNNLGDADTAKAETKITINAPAVGDDDDDDDDNSGSSNKGNGGGSIAHGPGSQVNAGKIAFKDLDTVPWAEDAILALVDKKVINGRSETIFDPNGTVTRAEFAKMVVLGFGLNGGTASNFTDVAATDWFAPYVATGYNNGVISGYDDGTFRPNGLISRQEMAAMISRAIAAANKTVPETVAAVSFDDAWQIGNWAMDSVTSLQKAGIINGMTATTFEPLANATRAQAAVIINRAINIAK